MINLNKTTIFILFTLGIIIIASCEVTVQKPVSTNPSSPAKEAAPIPPSTPTSPSTATPQITTPAASTSTKKITELTSVKCDGTTYNIGVKANHRILWIMLKAGEKQKVADLESQGLMGDYVEIAKNDGVATITFSDSHINGPLSPGAVVLIADVKKENADTVWSKIRNEVKGLLGLSYLGERFEEQDTTIEYTCKVK